MTTTATQPGGTDLLDTESRARAGRWRRVIRGRESDPRWVRPSLLGLLLATALLYLWDLGTSGWANDFYAAAVQAGTKSWKAFFFGSFDSSNFITVDKPPASLWVMELSARVFGLNSWSLLVPQALEGVAAVGLLYAAVRRYSTPAAGLLAGAVLATTPVAALMFRYDNPDALLLLLLVAAAYAVLRAVEHGHARWLVLAAMLVGTGFLTKMLQAFLVVPAFALVYLIAAPGRVRRRIGQLVLAGLALVVSAGWWVAIVEAVPAADRPYIGGSTTNNVLQLTFGYNGFGRLTGNETGSVAPGGGSFTRGFGASFGGGTGWTRLFSAQMGGQISWLLPAALIALVAGLWMRRRAPRTDPVRTSLLLWGGWLLVTGGVLSFAGGIIHPYYTVALAPAIGALVGWMAPPLWRARGRVGCRATLSAMLGVTVVWAFVLLDRTPAWLPWLRWVILFGGLLLCVVLLLPPVLSRRMAGMVAVAALVIGLAGPSAYAADTVSRANTGAIPSAGPSAVGGFGGRAPAAGGRPGGGGGFPQLPGGSGTGRPPGAGGAQAGPGGGMPGFPGGAGGPGGTGGPSRSAGAAPGGIGGGQTVSSALVALLRADSGSYRWVAAMTSASGAAPYQLAAGEPIMAIGGFNGTDQSLTLAAFQRLVSDHEVHYFIAGGGFGGAGGQGGDGPAGAGRSDDASSIQSWVASHFTARTVGGVTVYDLTATRR